MKAIQHYNTIDEALRDLSLTPAKYEAVAYAYAARIYGKDAIILPSRQRDFVNAVDFISGRTMIMTAPELDRLLEALNSHGDRQPSPILDGEYLVTGCTAGGALTLIYITSRETGDPEGHYEEVLLIPTTTVKPHTQRRRLLNVHAFLTPRAIFPAGKSHDALNELLAKVYAKIDSGCRRAGGAQ